MCGILGVATAGVDPPQGLVAGGLKYLEHRGPEAATQVLVRSGDRACVLGHTRLRIIDLREEADQPAQNEDGSIQVVFNGELYNFKELRAELEAKGHRFASDADTEVLAHLYEATEGDMQAMLDRLRGMFAFALWDDRRGRLMLARDRLGIKPMYFAALPGSGIAFGSESGALVRSGLVDAGPDTASILGYLMWGSVQGPRTILGGVQELQPGHYVSWDGSGHEERAWWEPAFEPRFDRDSSVERLRGALGDAVQRHLVADREVGLFLSGGVDSRAIAYTAARAGALRSLTVTFPEVRGDEGERAARVAAELGLHHETVPVLGSELAAVLPTIAAAMDQPTADGVNSWVVSRAAHQAGLVVALSGVGGDELFGGYPSFKLVPRVAAAGQRPAHAAPSRPARGRGCDRRRGDPCPRDPAWSMTGPGLRRRLPCRSRAVRPARSGESRCPSLGGRTRCDRPLHAAFATRDLTRRRGGPPRASKVSPEPAPPGHRRDVDGALIGGSGAAARRRRGANSLVDPRGHPESAGEAIVTGGRRLQPRGSQGGLHAAVRVMDARTPSRACSRARSLERPSARMAHDARCTPWTLAGFRGEARPLVATLGDRHVASVGRHARLPVVAVRILITVPSLAREFGGPTTKAIGLAAALRSLGHDVRIAGAGDQAGEGTIGLGRLGSFHGTPIPRTIAPLRRAIGGAEIVHVLGYRDPVGHGCHPIGDETADPESSGAGGHA